MVLVRCIGLRSDLRSVAVAGGNWPQLTRSAGGRGRCGRVAPPCLGASEKLAHGRVGGRRRQPGRPRAGRLWCRLGNDRRRRLCGRCRPECRHGRWVDLGPSPLRRLPDATGWTVSACRRPGSPRASRPRIGPGHPGRFLAGGAVRLLAVVIPGRLHGCRRKHKRAQPACAHCCGAFESAGGHLSRCAVSAGPLAARRPAATARGRAVRLPGRPPRGATGRADVPTGNRRAGVERPPAVGDGVELRLRQAIVRSGLE